MAGFSVHLTWSRSLVLPTKKSDGSPHLGKLSVQRWTFKEHRAIENGCCGCPAPKQSATSAISCLCIVFDPPRKRTATATTMVWTNRLRCVRPMWRRRSARNSRLRKRAAAKPQTTTGQTASNQQWTQQMVFGRRLRCLTDALKQAHGTVPWIRRQCNKLPGNESTQEQLLHPYPVAWQRAPVGHLLRMCECGPLPCRMHHATRSSEPSAS